MRAFAIGLLATLAAVAIAAVPAGAKSVQSTHFSLVTSQGLAGTLQYFSKHEVGGRRYLYSQIQVRITCSDGSSETGTLTLDGNLKKRDNDTILRVTESPTLGVTASAAVSVRLLPKIKGGTKKARSWKRARGSLSVFITDGTESCSTGPVEFSSAIAGPF